MMIFFFNCLFLGPPSGLEALRAARSARYGSGGTAATPQAPLPHHRPHCHTTWPGSPGLHLDAAQQQGTDHPLGGLNYCRCPHGGATALETEATAPIGFSHLSETLLWKRIHSV